MRRLTPKSTLTDTLFPDTPLFRSPGSGNGETSPATIRAEAANRLSSASRKDCRASMNIQPATAAHSTDSEIPIISKSRRRRLIVLLLSRRSRVGSQALAPSERYYSQACVSDDKYGR